MVTAAHSHRPALAMLAIILMALAAWTASVWVHDGDGTCGAVYSPNLDRGGCARMLAPRTLSAAVLAGGAVLSASAAMRREPRLTVAPAAGVAVLLLGAGAFLLLAGALDRPPHQATDAPPTPMATFPPPAAPSHGSTGISPQPPSLAPPTTSNFRDSFLALIVRPAA